MKKKTKKSYKELLESYTEISLMKEKVKRREYRGNQCKNASQEDKRKLIQYGKNYRNA